MEVENKKPQNPSAFPFVDRSETQNTIMAFSDGMTLRDYFAAKAMQVYLQEALRTNGASDHSISKASYFTADAMLKEREKQE